MRWQYFVRIACSLALSAICSSPSVGASSFTNSAGIVSDRNARKITAGLRTTEITKISFYGPQFGRFSNDPLVVTDRALVAQILKALQSAETRSLEWSNRSCSMEIHRRHGPKTIVLDLNPTSAPDSFGPTFRDCLLALGAYEANAARNTIQRDRRQIRSVSLGARTFQSQSDIDGILKRIAKTGGRAYAYTDPHAHPCFGPTLTFISGHTVSLNCVAAPKVLDYGG